MPRRPRIAEADLTDALVRVVAGEGLDAVSVRSVARAAGVSAGAVQYYFPTKDALLHAAYRRVIERVVARAARLPPLTRPRDFVRALLLELLPLDDEREAELRVGLAFSARSPFSEPLAELYTEGYRTLISALEAGLRMAVDQGVAAPEVDPRRDAVAAAATADGLAWHALCAPTALSRDEIVRALDAHLDRLFPPAGEH
ncbi:MAG TPA: TetR/AcrR family transcriptional regulator [Miltoncostaeaceae bacterium]|nr:TetR/AcrR family transcriptional regulator [Miltoncostaeaceae bacterium]